MKTRQVLMILFVSISTILGMTGVLADELTRTNDDMPVSQQINEENSNNQQEPLIAPPPHTEQKQTNKEYDNVVGEDLPDDTPHILDVGNDESNSDISSGDKESSLESDKSAEERFNGVAVAIGLGLAGLIIVGLLYIKRR